jgi:adenine-specific DNA-methyltransferase
MRPYPTLKLHLDQYQDVITSHNAPYGLHRARDENFFVGEKIIAVRKCDEPTFTFTDFPCYVSQTFNVIKTNRINLRYLTGFLNSKVVRFWLRNRGKMQGNNFQLDKEPLLAIPYLSPTNSEQARIARLVDQIIECKRQLSLSRSASQNEQLNRLCAEYENLIDESLEKFYDISVDEKVALSEI